MIRILLTASVVTGVASAYDPGVFERVVRTRQSYGSLPPDLPDYDGAHIALLNCDAVGETVLVCRGERCRFALVADCAGIADGGHAWMVRNRVAGELDPITVRQLDALGEEIIVFHDEPLVGIVPGRGLTPEMRR